MCKKVGAVDELNSGSLGIKSLTGLCDKQCAEEVAKHFAAVSNEYEPVNLSKLPAYLPSLPHSRWSSSRCTRR